MTTMPSKTTPVTVNLTVVHTGTERATVNLAQVGLVPFDWQDIRLKEAYWVNRKPYYTKRAIGSFLGYSSKILDRAINHIILRNPHIRQFATCARLTQVEGDREVTREVEVYDPIGLQLICFESRQPKALAYKVAVAHLVWAYVNGELRPPVDPDYRQELLALSAVPHGQKTLAVVALAETRACSRSTIYHHRTLERAGRDPSRKRHWTSMDHWDRRFPREKALVSAALAEGWPKVRIWREALGSPAKPSLYMVGALATRLARSQGAQ